MAKQIRRPATKRPRLEFYRDLAREWRWRAVGANGKVLADSAEGFRRSGRCYENSQKTLAALAAGKIRGLP